MDPSDDIRKLEGHLELIENILAHAGADDADGAQMVSEQFQACNELRPNLETAAEIVLDQDDGAALFSQITNVLERLENMEREWKTRKNSRPRVLSETTSVAPSMPPPTGTTGTQGSGGSQAFPAASPVSSQKSDKETGAVAAVGAGGSASSFPTFPASSWPAEAGPGASNFATFESASAWGNVGTTSAWGDATAGTASAWPEGGATFPASGGWSADAGGGWPAEEAAAPAALPAAPPAPTQGSLVNAGATPSPAASPALKAREGLGGLGGLGSSMQSLPMSPTSASYQLHIKCSSSDMEEVQRDQDRFKQRFVRAAAKAAGVPEYRIRVKSITNV